jgi:hypothetical protein
MGEKEGEREKLLLPDTVFEKDCFRQTTGAMPTGKQVGGGGREFGNFTLRELWEREGDVEELVDNDSGDGSGEEDRGLWADDECDDPSVGDSWLDCRLWATGRAESAAESDEEEEEEDNVSFENRSKYACGGVIVRRMGIWHSKLKRVVIKKKHKEREREKTERQCEIVITSMRAELRREMSFSMYSSFSWESASK